MAVNATPKAMDLIEDEKFRRKTEYEEEEEVLHPKPMTRMDIVKVAWKPYIPTTIMGSATIACIIAANTINMKRNAALTGAYLLSETALKDYKNKVIEKIGEKEEKLLRDDMAKDTKKKTKMDDKNIIITGNGNYLCLDVTSGRYFRSSVDKIKKAENDINKRLLTTMTISVNEIYEYMDLDAVDLGNEYEIDVNKDGYVEFQFGSCITDDDEPCITVRIATEYGTDWANRMK